MLLELSEIQSMLRARYSPEELEMLKCELRPSSLDDARIEFLEARLGVTLPPIFKGLVKQYDFSRFYVGAIFFGCMDDYAQDLERMNAVVEFNWWGQGGERPQHLLDIGGTDGYVLLLDTNTDEILAYLRSEWWFTHQIVAKNLRLLIRAEGTLMMLAHRTETLTPEEVAISLVAGFAAEVGIGAERGFWIAP